MKASRGGDDWWNFRDVELALGNIFLDWLLKSPYFVEHEDQADVVFVTRFGGLLSAAAMHNHYDSTLAGRAFKGAVVEYQRSFDSFLQSEKYRKQRGFGFVLEASHVYTSIDYAFSENNLFIATDPLFKGRNKILAPYVSVWPQRWLREKIDGCKKKYWLSFMGGLSGHFFHRQRERLQSEIGALNDRRIFWNHPNISRNPSHRWKWMCESKFCLDPEGDVPSTLREYEPVLVGCVPVMLTAYEYPFHKILGSYTQWAVVLPPSYSASQIVEYLEKMPESVYLEKRRKALEIADHFLYSYSELRAEGKASENIASSICDQVPKLAEDLSRIKLDDQHFQKKL